MRSQKASLERIESAVSAQASGGAESRRAWVRRISNGALWASVAGLAAAMVRSLVPNVLYEPSLRFKTGMPDQLPEGATFLEEQRVYIFREQKTFYAISAVCTHLGCTVQMRKLNQPKTVTIGGKSVQERFAFACPCHGSRYYGDGTNYAGPAPKPLAWYRLEVAAEDGQLVVDLGTQVGRDFRLTV